MNAINPDLQYKNSSAVGTAKQFVAGDCKKNAVQSAPVASCSGGLLHRSASSPHQGRSISLYPNWGSTYSSTTQGWCFSPTSTWEERPTSVSGLPPQTLFSLSREPPVTELVRVQQECMPSALWNFKLHSRTLYCVHSHTLYSMEWDLLSMFLYMYLQKRCACSINMTIVSITHCLHAYPYSLTRAYMKHVFPTPATYILHSCMHTYVRTYICCVSPSPSSYLHRFTAGTRWPSPKSGSWVPRKRFRWQSTTGNTEVASSKPSCTYVCAPVSTDHGSKWDAGRTESSPQLECKPVQVRSYA